MTTHVIPTVSTRRRRIPRQLPMGALRFVMYAVPVVLLGAWWLVSAASQDPYFPPLSRILERFRELWLFDHFASDIVPSLTNLLTGFLIAVAAGIALGFVLGLSRRISWLVEPIVHFWRAIPPVALIPIIVSLFGFGVETRVLAIALAAVFPTLITTIDAVRAVDPLQKDVMRVFHLTPAERIIRVILPASLPRIFSGMHVSLMVAFIVMIASEMLGPSVGIGALTLLAQQTWEYADMWAGILLLGVIGWAANTLFEAIERRALRWYHSAQKMDNA